MAFELDNSLFPSLRALLGSHVTATLLPDSVIQSDIFEGVAERWIDAKLTEEQQTEKATEAQTAALYYAAALIAPTIRVIARERIAGDEMQFESVDMQKRAAELLAQANAVISQIIEETVEDESTTFEIPIHFAIARQRLRY